MHSIAYMYVLILLEDDDESPSIPPTFTAIRTENDKTGGILSAEMR